MPLLFFPLAGFHALEQVLLWAGVCLWLSDSPPAELETDKSTWAVLAPGAC